MRRALEKNYLPFHAALLTFILTIIKSFVEEYFMSHRSFANPTGELHRDLQMAQETEDT
jgi:hypothetical protein